MEYPFLSLISHTNLQMVLEPLARLRFNRASLWAQGQISFIVLFISKISSSYFAVSPLKVDSSILFVCLSFNMGSGSPLHV